MPGSIQIAYRDNDRTPLLYLLKEMASRHEGLDIRIDQVHQGDAYEQGFLRGDLDVVCEHLRFLYPAHRDGYPVRCFASAQNSSVSTFVARPGINSVADLAGGTIAVRETESQGSVPRQGANRWLTHLGLEGKVELLKVKDSEVGRWQQWRKVTSGEADASQCSRLYLDAPLAAGLHLLEGPPHAGIGSLFFAALGPFMAAHEEEIRGLVRALYRALHVFHNDPSTTLEIMAGEPARLMKIGDDDLLRRQYESLRRGLDLRPVPTLQALVNTFEVTKEDLGGLDEMNPLTMWDLHYVLELEEAHFAEQLESELPVSAHS